MMTDDGDDDDELCLVDVDDTRCHSRRSPLFNLSCGAGPILVQFRFSWRALRGNHLANKNLGTTRMQVENER